MVTFEYNLKYNVGLPLEAYYDFETAASTDSCLDSEDKKMFAVSYAIIFAFHPQYHLDGVLIKRSSPTP